MEFQSFSTFFISGISNSDTGRGVAENQASLEPSSNHPAPFSFPASATPGIEIAGGTPYRAEAGRTGNHCKGETQTSLQESLPE
jgi:hypothetical protein